MEGLFQNLKEGLTLVTGSGHKATQHNYSPRQALNFFSAGRWLHVEQDFDFL